jgi:hypothetical protein
LRLPQLVRPFFADELLTATALLFSDPVTQPERADASGVSGSTYEQNTTTGSERDVEPD